MYLAAKKKNTLLCKQWQTVLLAVRECPKYKNKLIRTNYFPTKANTKRTLVDWSREGLLFSSSAFYSSNTGIPFLDFAHDQA